MGLPSQQQLRHAKSVAGPRGRHGRIVRAKKLKNEMQRERRQAKKAAADAEVRGRGEAKDAAVEPPAGAADAPMRKAIKGSVSPWGKPCPARRPGGRGEGAEGRADVQAGRPPAQSHLAQPRQSVRRSCPSPPAPLRRGHHQRRRRRPRELVEPAGVTARGCCGRAADKFSPLTPAPLDSRLMP
ncbi:unnamed protein product [Prorocentrum cordatum]|uniref:Uncharacterized protein n=1 Tax=Prorocentrum cordatum TaxID=2364126 RepID=A0ABN9RRC3_9DINO|nr:unnamed protein product [Polarella glacialis]